MDKAGGDYRGMMKAAVKICVLAAACLALITCAGMMGQSDRAVLRDIGSVLPEGWNVVAGDSILPVLWRGNSKCRSYYLVNSKVTLTEPTGGFDYHPFYDFWLCRIDFVGTQNPVGMVEQVYPAYYVADGRRGILFGHSIGESDWQTADEDVSRALGLQRPAKNEQACSAAMTAISDLKLPDGMEIDCRMTTRDSIFFSIQTFNEIAPDEMDAITDAIVRRIKNIFPDKERMVVARIYNGQFDTAVVGFKLKIR